MMMQLWYFCSDCLTKKYVFVHFQTTEIECSTVENHWDFAAQWVLLRLVFQIGRPSIGRIFRPEPYRPTRDQALGQRERLRALPGLTACARALPHLLCHKNASPLHTNSCSEHTNCYARQRTETFALCSMYLYPVHRLEYLIITPSIIQFLQLSLSFQSIIDPKSNLPSFLSARFFFFHIVHLSRTLCASAKFSAAYRAHTFVFHSQ